MPGHRIRIFVTPAAIAAVSLLPATAFAQARLQRGRRRRERPRRGRRPNRCRVSPTASRTWVSSELARILGRGRRPAGTGRQFPAQGHSLSTLGQGFVHYRNQTLAREDPYPKCVPHGGPRQFAAAGGFQILQMPEVQRIFIISGGAARTWRVIFMDGRSHPDINSDEFDPGYMGHSVGHWEGDTLVVDTVGFNEKEWLLGREGMPTTEALHLIERFSRPDFNTLRYEPTVDDPARIRSHGRAAGTFAG